MTKSTTLDRSYEWTFDLFVDHNAADGIKMAAAWDAIRDQLGDKAFKLAADMDVTTIEPQDNPRDMTWHVVRVACSKRAARAFERAGE